MRRPWFFILISTLILTAAFRISEVKKQKPIQVRWNFDKGIELEYSLSQTGSATIIRGDDKPTRRSKLTGTGDVSIHSIDDSRAYLIMHPFTSTGYKLDEDGNHLDTTSLDSPVDTVMIITESGDTEPISVASAELFRFLFPPTCGAISLNDSVKADVYFPVITYGKAHMTKGSNWLHLQEVTGKIAKLDNHIRFDTIIYEGISRIELHILGSGVSRFNIKKQRYEDVKLQIEIGSKLEYKREEDEDWQLEKEMIIANKVQIALKGG